LILESFSLHILELLEPKVPFLDTYLSVEEVQGGEDLGLEGRVVDYQEDWPVQVMLHALGLLLLFILQAQVADVHSVDSDIV